MATAPTAGATPDASAAVSAAERESRLLAAVEASPVGADHGRALCALGGYVAQDPTRRAEATRLLGEAMTACRDAQDVSGDGEACVRLGELFLLARDPDAARGYLHWARRCFREAEHAPGTARTLFDLGELTRLDGEIDAARIRFTSALAAFEGRLPS